MSLKLAVSNIWKSYAGNNVLQDCSFLCDIYVTYVIMGPNGCGKSTFLRICALLEGPDRGEINYFSGEAILRKDIELKRRITLVLPKVGAFNATVFNNTAYGLKIRGVKHIMIEEKVNSALDFVGLIHKRHHNALTLSSGEAQRMGIARAMVINPEILFLDEPTASVDQKNIEIIEDMILKIKKQGAPTVIMATHDTGQAQRLADILLEIKEKKISLR